MGRFSSFIGKAGDLVQQANEEYQRVKQQQEQQSQANAQLHGQSYGYSASAVAQPNTASQNRMSAPIQHHPQQVAHPPPPLPPRRHQTAPDLPPRPTQQSSILPASHGRIGNYEQDLSESVNVTHTSRVLDAPDPDTVTQQQETRQPQREANVLDQKAESAKLMQQTRSESESVRTPGSTTEEVRSGPRGAETGLGGPEGLQEGHIEDELVQRVQGLLVEEAVMVPRTKPGLPPRHQERTTLSPQTSSVSQLEYVAPSVEDESAEAPTTITTCDPVPEAPEQTRQPSVNGLKPVKQCIASAVCAEVDWFAHEEAPAFLVCSRCYVDYIYESKLRDLFQHKRFDDFGSVPRKCFFGTDRMKKRLWPTAAAQGSLNSILEYMSSRPQISECLQQTSMKRCEWWTTPDAPGLTFCQACWNDDIEGGPFASHFHLEMLEEPHVCSSSVIFIARMYNLHSEANNWPEFVAEAKGRFTIPPCPDAGVIAATAHAWMRSTREPKGLQICYACFADYFYGTASVEHFQPVAPEEDTTVCLMGQLNTKIPAQQAVAKKEPELFWKWIAEVDKHPFCSKKGITGSTSWYTLPNHPAGFAVCGACRAGIAEPTGWSRHLVPVENVSPEDTILCCLNPAHIRFHDFMGFLAPSIATDTWDKLGEYAAIFANVPRCPRDNTSLLSNRRYWGWQSLRICEECYLAFAKGTVLEPLYHLKAEVFETSSLCDLYSARMRRMYTDACEGRLPAQELVDFSRQRRETFFQTMPEVDRLITQQRIKSMQATMYGSMGSFYKFVGASHDAVVGHTYTVGNAYAGYGHANELSLTGAEYDRRGHDLSAQVTGGSIWHHISMLENRWREIE